MEEIKVFGNYEYRVVNKVPRNYTVWNIGSHIGTDEYIPFCRVIPHTFSIDDNSLLAVKLPKEEVEILRKVAGRGDTYLSVMQKRINKHRKYDYDKETLIKAKEILERIYE